MNESRPSGPTRATLRPTTLAFISVLAWLACSGSVGAQALDRMPPEQMVWRQWGVEEGLPQITVNDITQDDEGFLWIAHQEGVVRFDGIDFDTMVPTEGSELRGSMPNALATDGGGRLWVGAVGGVAVLEGDTLREVTLPDGGQAAAVLRLVHGHSGAIWVATVRGLLRHHDGVLQPVSFAGLGSPAALSVLDDGAGPVVMAGHRDLVIDPLGEARVIALPDTAPGILDIARDGPHGYWLGTRAGLLQLDADGTILQVVAGEREIERVLAGPDGRLWMASDRGLMTFSPGEGALTHAVPGIDASAWVKSLHFDREDNLWVGTQLTGLHRAWSDRMRRIGARQGLGGGAAWSVYQADDGTVWAGTPEGLYRGSIDGFEQALDASALPHPMVLSVLHDSLGRLWVGTRQGLVRRDPDGAMHEVGAAGNEGVHALLEVPAEGIYVGSMLGLTQVQGERTHVVPLPFEDGPPGIKALAMDATGRLWAGGFPGLFLRDQGAWTRLVAEEGQHPTVMSLTALPDGRMLASTHDGLFVFDDSRPGRQIGRDRGLHDRLTSYTAVVGSRVWYLSVLGIGSLPIEALEDSDATTRAEPARVFGLIGDGHLAQCNGGHQAAGLVSDGRWLWCPSLQGLLVVDTTDLDTPPAPPAPSIRRVTTPAGTHAVGRVAELGADDRDLRIDFSIASLRAPDQLTFESRLDGYDSRWQPLEKRRSAFYTNLPAGEYSFRVRAIPREGPPGEAAVQNISVQPHWYETWLAMLAALLVLGGCVALLLRWRVARIQRQRAQLQQAVSERTRELAHANAALEQASLTDPLTGLRNRRFLGQHLPMQVAHADRLAAEGTRENRDLVFLHVDLDQFKAINDRYGHQVGDEVLRETAVVLEKCSRASDMVVRWGGEEFVLVGRDTRRQDAPDWTERILSAMREHGFRTEAGVLTVTCTIGFAAYPCAHVDGRRLDWEAVLDMADAATYLAKREGRDRAYGIELEGKALPPDFKRCLHECPASLEAGGVVRIIRTRPDTATPAAR